MTTTTNLTLDLNRPTLAQPIHAKQGDSLTRNLAIALYDGETTWTVPSNITMKVYYTLPNKAYGNYTVTSSSGNVVYCPLSSDVCSLPGVAKMELRFTSGNEILTTFGWEVEVEASLS